MLNKCILRKNSLNMFSVPYLYRISETIKYFFIIFSYTLHLGWRIIFLSDLSHKQVFLYIFMHIL